MKKSSIVVFALLFVLSGVVPAQRGGHRQKQPSGPGNNPAPAEKDQNDKKKEADLAADSLKAKWKNAKTLEITATIKNMTNIAYSGARVVTIKFVGKDGKPETAKEESVTSMAANGSHTIKFETTDAKYFDKAGKWSLELSAGDPSAANDKKGPKTLEIPTQPKG